MAGDDHNALAECRATLHWLRSIDRRYLTGKLWPNVDASAGRNACWPWIGKSFSHGYGQIQVGRKPDRRTVRSHQLSYFLANEDIEISHWVLHSCDNRPCCNPMHLRGGTHAENTADAIERGRFLNRPTVRGEQHGCSRLTENDVRDIRALAHQGLLQRDIGQRFGIPQATVSGIALGKAWSHLNGKYPPVERVRHCKVLDAEKAKTIRSLYWAGCDQSILAKRFGVSPSAISSVVRNQAWHDPDWTGPDETPKHACNRRLAQAANEFFEKMVPHVREAMASGATSNRAIAAALNGAGLRSVEGSRWHHERVRQIRIRFNLEDSACRTATIRRRTG